MKTLLMLDESRVACAEPSCEVIPSLSCLACWGSGLVTTDIRARTLKRLEKGTPHGTAVHEGR